MSLSIDLLEAIKKPAYYIDYKELSVVEEVLIPSCGNDWTWYSYLGDVYLPETDVYESREEALEVLLGHVISIKKDTLLYLHQKEQDILAILSPETVDEGLIG